DVSLVVPDGEFLVLLGPSGCGKTTALRCIAGLEEPTAGEILIGDRIVTHDPPAKRDVAMVFQNYSVYPHLTVRENIAFALEMRRVPQGDIPGRVAAAAARMEVGDLLDRPADEFVARFIGRPGMNSLVGVADSGRGKRNGGAVVRCGSLTLPIALAYEGQIHLGVRPEHVTVCALDQGEGNAEVRVVEPL